MIYTHDTSAPLTKEQWDYNFQQLSLRYTLATGKPMPVTLRQNLSRPLTNREADTNFQNLDAALMRLEYGDGPYPVLDQTFVGASFLDPRITLTRPGKSWRTVNGVLREYDVDEPCLTGDGWSVRPAETNLVGADIAGANWVNAGPDRLTMGPVAQFAGFSLRQATVDVGAPAGAYVQWLPQITISPGRVTLSVYIRHDAPGWAYVMLRDDSKSVSVYAFVDLAAGVVGNAAGAPSLGLTLVGATMERLDEGVWRLDLVIQTDGTQIRPYLYGQVAGNGNISSEGLVGNVWYAAVQVNQGDPIPYIPTTDSAVTRPADNASIQGDAFASVWNPMEGAIIFDVVQPAFHPVSNGWMVGLNDGTLANTSIAGFYNRPADSNFNFLGQAIISPAIPPGTRLRGGLRWEGSAWSAALNGVLLGTKSIDGDPANVNQLWLGGLMAGSGLKSIVSVRRLTIFNRRPSDAQMEALTSP